MKWLAIFLFCLGLLVYLGETVNYTDVTSQIPFDPWMVKEIEKQSVGASAAVAGPMMGLGKAQFLLSGDFRICGVGFIQPIHTVLYQSQANGSTADISSMLPTGIQTTLVDAAGLLRRSPIENDLLLSYDTKLVVLRSDSGEMFRDVTLDYFLNTVPTNVRKLVPIGLVAEDDRKSLLALDNNLFLLVRYGNGSIYADRQSFSPNPVSYTDAAVAVGRLKLTIFSDSVVVGGTVGNGSRLDFYTHQANGSFSLRTLTNLTTLGSPDSVMLDDIDGDLFGDLVLCGSQVQVYLKFYHGYGNGSFSPMISLAGLTFLAHGQILPIRLANTVLSGKMDYLFLSGKNDYGDVSLLYKYQLGNFTQVSTLSPGLLYSISLFGPILKNDGMGLLHFGSGVDPRDPRELAIFDIQNDIFDKQINAVPKDRSYGSLESATCVIKDFTGDGCEDLYIQGARKESPGVFTGQTGLYKGDCYGGFTTANTNYRLGKTLALFVEDFDKNHTLEFFSIAQKDTQGNYTLSLYTLAPSGFTTVLSIETTFLGASVPQMGVSSTMFLADFNQDGYQDILIMYSPLSPVSTTRQVFINQKNLTFIASSNWMPVFVGATFRIFKYVLLDQGNRIIGAGHSDLSEQMEAFERSSNGSFVNIAATAIPSASLAEAYYLNAIVGIPSQLNDTVDDFICTGYDSDLNTATWLGNYFKRYLNGSYESYNAIGLALLKSGSGELHILDINGDGLTEIIVSGATHILNKTFVPMTIITRQANGSLEDRTSQFYSKQLNGYVSGAICSGSLTSKLDSVPDIAIIGISDGCGMTLLVSAQRLPNTTTSTTLGTSTSTSISNDGSEENSSPNTEVIVGTVLGAFGGAIALALLAFAVCLLCMFCLLCVLFLAVLLLLLSVGIVAIAGVGLVGASAAGGVGFLRLRHPNASSKDDEESGDAAPIEAMVANALMEHAFEILEWKDLALQKIVGSGSLGKVYQAEWQGTTVAAKLIENPTQAAAGELLGEAVTMARLGHHPHVARMIGVAARSDALALVMPFYAGGSLANALAHGLSPENKQRILYDIATGLAFLHQQNTVHGDVSARNVLLDGSGTAKLSDFGLARPANGPVWHEFIRDPSIGPVRWMAPESLSNGELRPASDAYAFGVLMTEVWSNGQPPFRDVSSVVELIAAVVQENRRPDIPSETPAAHVDLIHRLFNSSPSLRPSMASVVQELGQIASRSAAHSTDVAPHSVAPGEEYVDAAQVK